MDERERRLAKNEVVSTSSSASAPTWTARYEFG